MTERYKASDRTECGCCTHASVIDTAKPRGMRSRISGEPIYEVICECFDMEDAERIAEAMNRLWGALADDNGG